MSKKAITLMVAGIILILGILVLTLKKDYNVDDILRSNEKYYEFLDRDK